VIRDENGTFLKVMARCIPAPGSALMMEVEAWLAGLRLLGPEPQGKSWSFFGMPGRIIGPKSTRFYETFRSCLLFYHVLGA
jgi:hypothetical protein